MTRQVPETLHLGPFISMGRLSAKVRRRLAKVQFVNGSRLPEHPPSACRNAPRAQPPKPILGKQTRRGLANTHKKICSDRYQDQEDYPQGTRQPRKSMSYQRDTNIKVGWQRPTNKKARMRAPSDVPPHRKPLVPTSSLIDFLRPSHALE